MLQWGSPNSSCHQCNHTSFFLQSLHQSSVCNPVKWSPLHFISSKIIDFDHRKPIKMKILRLLSVGTKFAKLPMSLFECKSILLQTLHYSSVLWRNSPVLFLNQTYWQKKHIKVQVFKVANACIKTHQSHFCNQVSVFPQSLHHHLRVIGHNSSILFVENFICFIRKQLNKVKILILSTARMKIS